MVRFNHTTPSFVLVSATALAHGDWVVVALPYRAGTELQVSVAWPVLSACVLLLQPLSVGRHWPNVAPPHCTQAVPVPGITVTHL